MLSLLFFGLIAAARAACPATYQQINGGDCFKLYTATAAFDAAEAQCMQDGGHLASVHSANEQAALAAIIGATTPLIGIKCTDGTAGHCTWADGSTMDYSNFPGGAPVINYGSCAHLASADTMWYSWNCAAPLSASLCRVSFNAPATVCTGDYVSYNGGCAALKRTTRLQADAEAACVQDGGHLASIQSQTDNAFYSNLASGQGLTNNIYIGLAWNIDARTYKWTDGSQYTYNNFANQFPNTAFGDCVQMMLSTEFGTLGQWTNIPCSTPMAYVCWKAANADTVSKAPAQCPPIQFFYNEGTVYSPDFPLSIPSGQTCEYILSTAVNTRVSVSFPSFSSDAGTSLFLYDGLDDTAFTAKLSGTVNPQTTYESATNVMKMIFIASAAATGQGWQADFRTIGGAATDSPVQPSLNCPEQQYTADTYIYSPNWPNQYPPMADCLYYIHSQNNRKMTIEFGYVDTEQCCDFITVYDGPSTNSPVLGRVSGQSGAQVKQFYSSGTTLTLEFVSDSNNQGNGWVASAFNL